MSLNNPRLRGTAPRRSGPYPLGQLPNSVLLDIGKQLTHRLSIGQRDITGDDFGTIFAEAIGATHLGRPLGIADVVLNQCAWSAKTVKATYPFLQKSVRLISGRNSPDYSLGIANPRSNPQATGDAVLSVWNARVDEAFGNYNDLRIIVLVRNVDTKQFLIFEEDASRFITTEYQWAFNKGGNLVGKNTISGGHHFTWQPHGSQFTILRSVPSSARRFSINHAIPMVTANQVLTSINFQPNWIHILP